MSVPKTLFIKLSVPYALRLVDSFYFLMDYLYDNPLPPESDFHIDSLESFQSLILSGLAEVSYE